MAKGTVLQEFLIQLGLDLNAQSFAKGQIAVDLLKQGLRGITAAVKSLPNMAIAAANYANDITDMSEATGIGVERFQELAFAFKSAGVDISGTTLALGEIGKTIVQANQGNEAAQKSLKRLGLNYKELGKLAPEAAVDAFADAIKRSKDGSGELTAGADVAGKGFKALHSVFNQGSEGLRKYAKAGRESGNVQDASVIAKNDAASKSIKAMSTAWDGAKLAIGSKLLPVLVSIVEPMTAWLNANREAIASGIVGFVEAVAGAFKVLGVIVGAVAVAFEFLGDHMLIVSTILGAILLPVLVSAAGALWGLVVAAGSAALAGVAAAATWLFAWIAAMWPLLLIGAAIGALIYAFVKFKKQTIAVFKAIWSVIKEFATLPAAIWAGFKWLGSKFVEFGKATASIFVTVGSAIKDVFIAVWDAIAGAFNVVFGPIKAAIMWAIDKAEWLANQFTGPGEDYEAIATQVMKSRGPLSERGSLSERSSGASAVTPARLPPGATPGSVSTTTTGGNVVNNGPSTYNITTKADPAELTRKLEEYDAAKNRATLAAVKTGG